MLNAPQLVVSEPARVAYKAFDAPTAEKQEGFAIHTRKHGVIMPTFSLYCQANYEEDGSRMALLFSHQIIRLEGANLDQLAQPLRNKTLEAMREHDPRKHLPPEPESCVIESIEVLARTADSCMN